VLRIWSAGCAAGEEPYTLALIWQFELAEKFPHCRLEIVATDADPASLERARRACYPPASLRELPRAWREAFVRGPAGLCLEPAVRATVTFRCADLRREAPAGPFHLILCRNLAFTYFAEPFQGQAVATVTALLAPGGALLIGARERLPGLPSELIADGAVPGLFWRA